MQLPGVCSDDLTDCSRLKAMHAADARSLSVCQRSNQWLAGKKAHLQGAGKCRCSDHTCRHSGHLQSLSPEPDSGVSTNFTMPA